MKDRHPGSRLILPVEDLAIWPVIFFSHAALPAECLDARERKIYQSIRESLLENLSLGQRQDVLLLALIERVARTAVFLDKLERVFIRRDTPMTSCEVEGGKSDYPKVMREHRKCIELLAGLKGSDVKKGRTRIMEELRRTVQES